MSNVFKAMAILAGLSFFLLHACRDSKVTGTENDTDNTAATDTTGMDHSNENNNDNDGSDSNNEDNSNNSPWQKELLISSFIINGEEIFVNEESATPDEIVNYINYDNLPANDYQLFSVTVYIPVDENGDYQTDLQENYINLVYSEGAESDDITANIAFIENEIIDGAEYSKYVVEGQYNGLSPITRYSFEELTINVDVVYLSENEGEVNRREVEYNIYVKGEAPPEEMNWNVITLNSDAYDDIDWKDMNRDGLTDYVVNKGEEIEVYYNQAGTNPFLDTPDVVFTISDLPDLFDDSYGTPRDPKLFDGMAALDWDGDGDGDILTRLTFNWIDDQRPYPSLIMLENNNGTLRMYKNAYGLLPFKDVDTFEYIKTEDLDSDGDEDILFFAWWGDHDKTTLDYIENEQNRMRSDIQGGRITHLIQSECLRLGGVRNLRRTYYAVYPKGIFIISERPVVLSCGNRIVQEFYPDKYNKPSDSSAEGDVDGDGTDEFFILHPGNKITIANSISSGEYSSFEITDAIGDISNITTLDVNKDGYEDLIAITFSGGTANMYYLKSSGNGTFQTPQQITSPQGQFNSGSMRTQDINADGCEDVTTKGNVVLNPCL